MYKVNGKASLPTRTCGTGFFRPGKHFGAGIPSGLSTSARFILNSFRHQFPASDILPFMPMSAAINLYSGPIMAIKIMLSFPIAKNDVYVYK